MLAERQDFPPNGGTEHDHYSQPEQLQERLRDLWQTHREGMQLPLRQRFEPMSVVDLLPYIAILTVGRGPLDFAYRLTGTELDRHMGRVLKGQKVSEIQAQCAPSSFWDLLAETVTRGEPCARQVGFLGSTYDLRQVEVIALPYSLDGSQVDQIIIGTRFVSAGLV